MHGLLGVEVMLVVVCLMFYILSAEYLEHRKIEYINESSLAIILGLLLGLFVLVLGNDYRFSSSVVFYFLLPPIIFAAGYTLKTKSFFGNIGYISLYGLAGTFTMFLLIGLLAIGLKNSFGLSSLSSKECLLLASVLSATDTVAAITVVKENKYPKLHSVLFGEGVLNDAVSIVIYRTVESVGDIFSLKESYQVIATFIVSTAISIAIGISTGFLAAYVFKKNQRLQRRPDREVGIVILIGYLSYIISELIGLSGIMAIFCCSVTMAHYTHQNTSKSSQQATGLIFTVMSQGAEAFTFTYLGMNLMTFQWSDIKIGFTLFMILAMIFSRFASIFVSSYVVYLIRRKNFGLDNRSLSVIWYTGLIRGTIAVALALQIDSENKGVMVTTTLIIAISTTLIFSNLISTFTRYVNLEISASQEYLDFMPDSNEEKTCLKLWKSLDHNYLNKWFGKNTEVENSWKQVWKDDKINLNELTP